MTVRRAESDGKVPKGFRKETVTGDPDRQPPLLTQRAALILIAAAIIGTAAGILAALAGDKLASAVLTGGGAFAGAVALLNVLIG